ncbi:MAG TPA: glycoside hydrolase family 2 TIM barrel-domain containing protein [Clostridia bacterium]|nr:glycoside hydrolase family 2 TIM barrel-domain containing protein [Clostridia bacterium]
METADSIRPLYTPWGETIDRERPLNDYPRPQMRRENWKCLNGRWEYAIRENGAFPDAWDGEILVPFSPESLLSGVGRQLMPGQTLWYRKHIEMEELADNRVRLLHFGAVDQHCLVWCNERRLGEHSGGYWPFSFDITDAARGGSFTLTLAVNDESDGGDEAYGKQKLERGGIWYTGQSGIWQTVWCEDVPERHIESLRITPLWREGAVEVKAQGDVPSCSVRVLDAGNLVAQASAEGGFIRLQLPDFKSWSPDDPFLYDLEVQSGEDTVYSYFGMREFGVANGADGLPRLMLNGRPVFHNGLLDQGYWSDGMYTPPSDDAMAWEISQLKRMGFNMLRKHIKIEPLRWYYHCDRLGMLVWQDFVSGGGPYKKWVVQFAPFLGLRFGDGPKRYAMHGRQSGKGREAFVRDAKRTTELLYNAVSLSAWVPFNEGWGQFDAAAMCEAVRRMDPTRQVDHASGYFDQGAGDVHSCHIYYRHFSPGKDKRPGRVLGLTEFGGYSLPVKGHMAAGKLFGYKIFDNRQALQGALRRLYERDVLPAIKKGLGALVYTQVSDVEEEINGLFTYDRKQTKVDAAFMRAINGRVYEAFYEKAGK